MLHEKLDLFRWVHEFPLTELREEASSFVLQRRKKLPKEYPDQRAVERHINLMYPSGEIIVGPKSLAINHQLREEAFEGTSYAGARAPTDVFVWGRGEPTMRCVTKVGGIPYWPADQPWPHGADGGPIRFIAQICFADSTDIIGSLPGEVLLILGDNDALLEPELLLFKWLPLGIDNVVMEIPQKDQAGLLSPFYGVIHRTEDWPDAMNTLKVKYRYPQHIAVMEGAKIGGFPSWIQTEELLPGRFLASLGTISVGDQQKWPFVNMPEPRQRDDSDLHIGDMGSLYLFIDSQGIVNAVSQCY